MNINIYNTVLNCLTDKIKSTTLIAKESGYCFNTAERALKELVKDGLAKKLRGRSKSSVYKNVWVLENV